MKKYLSVMSGKTITKCIGVIFLALMGHMNGLYNGT